MTKFFLIISFAISIAFKADAKILADCHVQTTHGNRGQVTLSENNGQFAVRLVAGNESKTFTEIKVSQVIPVDQSIILSMQDVNKLRDTGIKPQSIAKMQSYRFYGNDAFSYQIFALYNNANQLLGWMVAFVGDPSGCY